MGEVERVSSIHKATVAGYDAENAFKDKDGVTNDLNVLEVDAAYGT